MKNIIISTTILLLASGASKAQMVVQNGAILSTTGNTLVTLENLDLQNNGTMDQTASTGKFRFSGTVNNAITGSSSTTFSKLEIAKTGINKLSLGQTIYITNGIDFTSGLIDLNNNNILLKPTALLVGESEASRITGANGGYTQIIVPLNAPAATNAGNLGASISSTQNLGSTTIRRGHVSQVNGAGGGNSIYRSFIIIPTNNTTLDATIRFAYFDAELNGLAENGLNLWRSTTNTDWQNMGFTTRDQQTNYVEKIHIDNLYRFTLSSDNNALPLVYTGFKATCNDGTAVLDWTTAQEQNTNKFQIQKSKDGTNWQPIGTVAAVGNSPVPHQYFFTDNNPFAGANFYRVAEYDKNGQVFYSTIQKLDCSGGTSPIKIYPNPVQDYFVISLTTKKATVLSIQILDGKGALVQQRTNSIQLGSNQITVDAKMLAAGSYYLHLSWNDGQSESISKLIKK